MTDYSNFRKVQVGFANHGDPRYSNVHQILARRYAHNINDTTIFFNTDAKNSTTMKETAVGILRKCICDKIAYRSSTPNDRNHIDSITQKLPLMTISPEDQVADELVSKHDFLVAIEEAIECNCKAVKVQIDISKLHFRNTMDSFNPNDFYQIGFESFFPEEVGNTRSPKSTGTAPSILKQEDTLHTMKDDDVNRKRRNKKGRVHMNTLGKDRYNRNGEENNKIQRDRCRLRIDLKQGTIRRKYMCSEKNFAAEGSDIVELDEDNRKQKERQWGKELQEKSGKRKSMTSIASRMSDVIDLTDDKSDQLDQTQGHSYNTRSRRGITVDNQDPIVNGRHSNTLRSEESEFGKEEDNEIERESQATNNFPKKSIAI